MPYLCTAPSQITDQVQPFASGTFTVNVAKLLAIVAERLCAWICGERSVAVGVGVEPAVLAVVLGEFWSPDDRLTPPAEFQAETMTL